MQTSPRIIGNHVLYFPDGKALDRAGTGPGDAAVDIPAVAGRNVKPDAADTGWIDFGVINNVGVQHDRTEQEVYAPSPGQLRLYDVLETKRKLGIKWECEELSPLSFEMAFGTDPLTAASDDYNPLKGAVKKGWIKVQQYGHNDELINTVDVYVHIKSSGEVKFDDNVVKTPMEALVLHSVLNAGTLEAV